MSGIKKFFGIGLLALLTTAYLTSSCSRDDFNGSMIDAKAEAFNEVFIDTYGTPNPQQDWGFGDGETRAFTRGADPDGNEWAESWLVPDPLTDGQKERVYRYFQSHPNLGYQDPGWSNYFMQQVYKGGGSKRNDSQWCTSEKDEWYTSANNGSVIGSDHMDHLIAKSSTGATDHIYNFNNGTCSPNPDILDNGYTVNEWADHHHSDEIQLMTGSYTYTFTYGSSDASMVRERRCALVSAAEIDRWATEEAGGIGATVNDKWHRSFMGFDFEQRVSDEIFAKDENSADGFKYATIGDGPTSKNFYWDGEQVLPLTDELKSTALGVRMLVNESNMYCGTNGDIDGNDLYSKHLVPIEVDGQTRYQEDDCLDLSLVYDRIEHGYYPIEGSNLTKWVKPEGGADGYYSDWIVTLSEAQPKNGGDNPTENSDIITVQEIIDGRIFCEDLGSSDKSDIDYNDVVFDAFTYVTKTYKVNYTLNGNNKVYDWANKEYQGYTYDKTDINLLAAGGTIAIRVAGQDVNQKLGINQDIMANTYVDGVSINKSGYSNFINKKSPVKFTVNNQDYVNLKLIPILVKFGTEVRELQAIRGSVPQKFLAPVGTPWPAERVEIHNGFPQFSNWVTKIDTPWGDLVPYYLYNLKFVSNSSISQLGGTIDKYNGRWGTYPAMYVNGENLITITLGQALQEGDQIAITGYRENDDNTAGTLYIKCNGNVVAQMQDYNNISYDASPNTFVFSVPSEMAGYSSFQLSKDASGAEIYITGITVIGGLGPQQNSSSSSNNGGNGNGGNNNGGNGNNSTPPNVEGPAGHTATWSGTQEFTVKANGDWDGNIEFTLDNCPALNAIGEGTYIDIYGYGTSNDWRVQTARQKNSDPWTWTDLTKYQRGASTVNASTVIEFGPLTAEEAEAIKQDGKLVIYGKNFVVKYVDIDNSGVSAATTERVDLTFGTEWYNTASWNAGTRIFTWGSGGANNPDWVFINVTNLNGDLSKYTKLYFKLENFTNSVENKLTLYFKENKGDTQSMNYVSKVEITPNANGVFEFNLTNFDWKNNANPSETIDKTKIYDVTLYGGARTDGTQDGSVKITEAYVERTK